MLGEEDLTLANIIIAFDVDGTLEISGGSIKLKRLRELKEAGAIVGIVGNWRKAIQHIWGLDFYQEGIPNKAEILKALGEGKALKIYVADLESDREQAEKAGWIFIHHKAFK